MRRDHDLNIDGDRCESAEDLRSFVEQLCDVGAFDALTRSYASSEAAAEALGKSMEALRSELTVTEV